jgi:hypothetical protein
MLYLVMMVREATRASEMMVAMMAATTGKVEMFQKSLELVKMAWLAVNTKRTAGVKAAERGEWFRVISP